MERITNSFASYPEIKDLYVVHRQTGCGEQGGEPIRVHEIVYTTSSMEDLVAWCNTRFPRDPSGWTYENPHTVVNTSTEEGQRMKGAYDVAAQKRSEAFRKEQEEHPERFTTIRHEGYTITMKHCPEFDDNIKPATWDPFFDSP